MRVPHDLKWVIIAYSSLKSVRIKAWLSFRRTKNLDCTAYACVVWTLVIRLSCWLKECMITPLMLFCKNLWKPKKKIFLFPFSSSKTCGFVILKHSRDRTHALGGPRGFKGLLHILNATITLIKRWFPHVFTRGWTKFKCESICSVLNWAKFWHLLH